MTHFVTQDKIEVRSNLTKRDAVALAITMHEKGNTSIGIGKIKYVDGKKYYTCLPLHLII